MHAALAPGGLVVDTQPVSIHPRVDAESGEHGTLDMRDWGLTIELVDVRFEATFRDGLFALEAQSSLVVADSFDDGAEMLTKVSDWQGTTIPTELEQHLGRSHGPDHVN